MVTYDSVDRLKFLSTMQVLEFAKNNIVLLGNFIWFMLFNTEVDNYYGGY